MTTPSVLVPLAAGCEELEAVTIIDLLHRAGIAVTVAGLQPGPVTASRGVGLMPDTTIDEALTRRYDAVVLPGGQPGTDNLVADERITALLGSMDRQGLWIGAICAAPKVLFRAGVLKDRTASAYPGVLEAEGHDHLSNDPVTRDGHVITSRGPGTAMDFALTLIEQLAGRDTRNEVEAALQRP